MALSKNEAIKMAKGFLDACSKKHDIKRAYIFGSFAKGTVKDYSDVDLAVVLGSLRTADEAIYDEDFEIFHEAQQYNALLEVVCFLEDAFDRNEGTIINRIRKEGIAII
ncbi:MAG: nucleotidyltransferase domain-containing protein [Deltaproteobacteria bacterium]|nr:nucleotidyltransferase domain-containing protein [Deltaproteobacteria bacterium]